MALICVTTMMWFLEFEGSNLHLLQKPCVCASHPEFSELALYLDKNPRNQGHI